MSRDRERIPQFLARFGELWERVPDIRFGQLVDSIRVITTSDIFYIEDNEYLRVMEDIINQWDRGGNNTCK